MNNKFIVFEGLDGSGKTTLSKLYYEYLVSQGIDAILITTGYSEIDEAIRVIKNDRLNYDIRVHFLLALSNSIMTYKSKIEANLKKGKVVILDRYYFTTLAYNMALGLDENWAKNVALMIPKPDKVIFCNASMEKILKNKAKKIEDIEIGFSNSLDKQKAFIKYQSIVKHFYQKLINDDPSLFYLLDTDRCLEDCFEELKNLDNIRRKKYGK